VLSLLWFCFGYTALTTAFTDVLTFYELENTCPLESLIPVYKYWRFKANFAQKQYFSSFD
jgi:hypothetical protein